jgi:hypothetical protein
MRELAADPQEGALGDRRFMGLCGRFMGSCCFRAWYVLYVVSKPMKGATMAAAANI